MTPFVRYVKLRQPHVLRVLFGRFLAQRNTMLWWGLRGLKGPRVARIPSRRQAPRGFKRFLDCPYLIYRLAVLGPRVARIPSRRQGFRSFFTFLDCPYLIYRLDPSGAPPLSVLAPDPSLLGPPSLRAVSRFSGQISEGPCHMGRLKKVPSSLAGVI